MDEKDSMANSVICDDLHCTDIYDSFAESEFYPGEQLFSSTQPASSRVNDCESAKQSSIVNFTGDFNLNESINFLSLLSKTSHASKMEELCPALLVIADKHGGDAEVASKMLEMCRNKLLNFEQSRLVRKFGISVLKWFLTASHKSDEEIAVWNEFLVLLNGLEEPQFHLLVPLLPKMDTLLTKLLNTQLDIKEMESFTWQWLQLVIEKGIRHTNGWIRLWAFQKFVDVPHKVLGNDFTFLLNILIPALNDYDPFWRLMEKNELEGFIQKLETVIANFMEKLEGPAKIAFQKRLLGIFTVRWCPSSVLFLSKCLCSVEIYPAFVAEHFEMFKIVLGQITQVQYAALTISILANFFSYFFRLVCWTSETVWLASSLLRFIANVPHVTGIVTNLLGEALSGPGNAFLADYDSDALLNDYLEFELDAADRGISAPVVWILANKCSASAGLFQQKLEVAIVDLIDSEVPEYERVDILLLLWIQQSKENNSHSQMESLREIVRNYVIMRLFSLGAAEINMNKSLASSVYIDVLKYLNNSGNGEGCLEITKQNAELINCVFSFFEQANTAGNSLSPEHEANLYKCAMECLSAGGKENSTIASISADAQDLAAKLFSSTSESTTIFGCSAEFLLCQKLDFLLKYLSLAGAESLVFPKSEICVDLLLDWLNSSIGFDCRRSVLRALKVVVTMGDDFEDELAEKITETLTSTAILTEEKGTRNYVTSVELVLDILLQERIFKRKTELGDRVVELVDRLIDEANENIPLGVVVSEALLGAKNIVQLSKWSEQLIKLAVFGPIQKKHVHTLFGAFRMVYSSKHCSESVLKILPKDKRQLLNLAPHFIRLNAISLCLIQLNGSQKDEEKVIAASSFFQKIIGHSTELDGSKSRSYGLSLAHRQKTRLIQLLLLVVDTVPEGSVDQVFEFCVQSLLDTSQQFSIKLLVEWTILRLCKKYPRLLDSFVALESQFASQRIGSVASWINVLRHHYCSLVSEESSLHNAFLRLLPWCTAQNFSVRCTAIAALKMLWRRRLEVKNHVESASALQEMALVEKVVDFNMEPSGNGRKIIDRLCTDFYFGHFNQDENYDLETIFKVFPSKLGMPEEEQIELKLLQDQFRDFSEPSGMEFKMRIESNSRSFFAAPSLIYSGLSKNNNSSPTMENCEILPPENAEMDLDSNTAAAVQRKLQVSRRNQNESSNSSSAKQLIVVASLVSKPANLGGLCRTCEIFGVSQLVVGNSSVISDPEFKALSMASENWMQIEQVKTSELKQYLRGKRSEGFVILAAEQTTRSERLEDFQFPDKCLLLMGDEREGVPVELIQCVEKAVEITQLGQTRSLNVHVTAALFIYQFASQKYLRE